MFQVLATNGDTHLGGDDIDLLLDASRCSRTLEPQVARTVSGFRQPLGTAPDFKAELARPSSQAEDRPVGAETRPIAAEPELPASG